LREKTPLSFSTPAKNNPFLSFLLAREQPLLVLPSAKKRRRWGIY